MAINYAATRERTTVSWKTNGALDQRETGILKLKSAAGCIARVETPEKYVIHLPSLMLGGGAFSLLALCGEVVVGLLFLWVVVPFSSFSDTNLNSKNAPELNHVTVKRNR